MTRKTGTGWALNFDGDKVIYIKSGIGRLANLTRRSVSGSRLCYGYREGEAVVDSSCIHWFQLKVNCLQAFIFWPGKTLPFSWVCGIQVFGMVVFMSIMNCQSGLYPLSKRNVELQAEPDSELFIYSSSEKHSHSQHSPIKDLNFGPS